MEIIFTDDSGALQSVTVNDLNHEHLGTAEPTDSPVEDGSNITDHIRANQREFSAKCFVSDTLFEAEATQMGGATQTTTQVQTPSGKGIAVTSFTAPIQRVKLVYDALEEIRVGRKTCTIVTPLRRYESMCITSLGFPVTNSDGITFDLQAREVRIATTQHSGTPTPRETRGHRRAVVGAQPTTPAPTTGPSAPPAEPASRSGAAALLDSFGSLF